MRASRMWETRDDMRQFWRVEVARNVVLFQRHSFVLDGSQSQPRKNSCCGESAAKGTAKICTALWREGGFEVVPFKDALKPC